ncbi:MAG: hypothetical protein EXR98_19610 [Gemmataceae bacterium]|nr:hypothetical protein [Gemmataceae bacterium]
MSEVEDSNPVPGIRGVFIAGFFSGNISGLTYLTINGHLIDSVTLNPIALIGAFLGIGLVGAMLGGLSGLSVKLLRGAMKAKDGWHIPVAVAAAVSATVGLLISWPLIAVLFGD